jgi:hypothetical protein
MNWAVVNDPEQLSKVKQHMESIGFRTKEDHPGFSAYLENKAFMNTINVRPLNGGFHIYLKMRLKPNRDMDMQFAELMNGMNNLSSIWRTFVNQQGDLVQDLWYCGPYTKKHFERVLSIAENEGKMLTDNFGELYDIYCA